MLIDKTDLARYRKRGTWLVLKHFALGIIESAREAGGNAFAPALGGGTRLMLAVNHRISSDIDLFMDSPEWLAYVSPRLNKDFKGPIPRYEEFTDHVRFILAEGEIDFIVAADLFPPGELWNPFAPETTLPLEAPGEILAKKLFFRGWSLTPRDLFDWVMLDRLAPRGAMLDSSFSRLLSSGDKLRQLKESVSRFTRPTPGLKMSWQAIQSPYEPDLEESASWALRKIEKYRTMAGPGRSTPRAAPSKASPA